MSRAGDDYFPNDDFFPDIGSLFIDDDMGDNGNNTNTAAAAAAAAPYVALSAL